MIHLTAESFIDEVVNSDKPVLVDFWATWCGPCQMQAPIFEEVASENDGSAKFAKLDVDEAMEIAQKYGIQSIPTIVLFKNGEAKDVRVGLQSKNELLDMIG